MKGIGPSYALFSSFVILFGAGCSSMPPPGVAQFGIGVTEAVSQQAEGEYFVDRVVDANQAFVSADDEFLIHVTAKAENESKVRPVSIATELGPLAARQAKYGVKITKLDASMVHKGWLDPTNTFGSAAVAVPVERNSRSEEMIESEYHRDMVNPYFVGVGEAGCITIFSKSPLEFPGWECEEPRHHLSLSLPDKQGRSKIGYVLLLPFGICVDIAAMLVVNPPLP